MGTAPGHTAGCSCSCREPRQCEGARAAPPGTGHASGVARASGARHLPQDVGAAIDDARTLFEELQVRGKGATDTLRFVLYTLRHFPLYDAVARVNDCLGGLQDWLQPEDLTTSAK